MLHLILNGNLIPSKGMLKILAVKVLMWSSVAADNTQEEVKGRREDYSRVVKIIPALFEKAILDLNHPQKAVTFKTTNVWLRRT